MAAELRFPTGFKETKASIEHAEIIYIFEGLGIMRMVLRLAFKTGIGVVNLAHID